MMSLRTLIGSLCLLLILSWTPLAWGEAARSPVFQHPTVDQAWQTAQQSGRPVLLFVSMRGCHYCAKMLKETYSHPQIAQGINELFETAIVKKEQRPDLVKKLGIRAFPTTLVISPDGKLIARIDGFADPKKFVSVLRPALAAYAEANRTVPVSQQHSRNRSATQ